jgi:hypothetical protein
MLTNMGRLKRIAAKLRLDRTKSLAAEGGRVIGIGEGHVHEHTLHDYECSANIKAGSDDSRNPVDGFTRRPCWLMTLSACHDFHHDDAGELTV